MRPPGDRPWRLAILAVAGALVLALIGLGVSFAVGGNTSSRPRALSTTTTAVPPTTGRSSTTTSSSPSSSTTTGRATTTDRATTTTPASTTTTTVPGAAAGPVPPGFQPQSVTFVSTQAGWVLGGAPCSSPPCTSVIRTDDGGRSWVGINAPRVALAASPSQGTGVSRLVFADQLNGWAFGPALWSTHDGGRTWEPVDLPGAGPAAKVVSLATSGGRAVALALMPAQAGGGQGVAQLYTTPVGRDGWQPVANVSAPTYSAGQVVLHGQAGWVTIDTGSTGPHYWATTGGTTFTPQSPTPCQQEQSPSQLAASSPTDLVLGCGRQGGLGRQVKEVYVSTNGGASFRATAAPPAEGDLEAVAEAIPSVLVVGASSGASYLYASFDGGQSWQTVVSDSSAGGAPWHDLGFTTATQGVVVEGYPPEATSGTASTPPSRLLATTDGGHTWAAVTFGP